MLLGKPARGGPPLPKGVSAGRGPQARAHEGCETRGKRKRTSPKSRGGPAMLPSSAPVYTPGPARAGEKRALAQKWSVRKAFWPHASAAADEGAFSCTVPAFPAPGARVGDCTVAAQAQAFFWFARTGEEKRTVGHSAEWRSAGKDGNRERERENAAAQPT